MIKCYKTKSGRSIKIPANVCSSQKKIGVYLDKGYTISKVTETKTKHGEKTIIKTFSPLTRDEAWAEHKKRWGRGVPF